MKREMAGHEACLDDLARIKPPSFNYLQPHRVPLLSRLIRCMVLA